MQITQLPVSGRCIYTNTCTGRALHLAVRSGHRSYTLYARHSPGPASIPYVSDIAVCDMLVSPVRLFVHHSVRWRQCQRLVGQARKCQGRSVGHGPAPLPTHYTSHYSASFPADSSAHAHTAAALTSGPEPRDAPKQCARVTTRGHMFLRLVRSV